MIVFSVFCLAKPSDSIEVRAVLHECVILKMIFVIVVMMGTTKNTLEAVDGKMFEMCESMVGGGDEIVPRRHEAADCALPGRCKAHYSHATPKRCTMFSCDPSVRDRTHF